MAMRAPGAGATPALDAFVVPAPYAWTSVRSAAWATPACAVLASRLLGCGPRGHVHWSGLSTIRRPSSDAFAPPARRFDVLCVGPTSTSFDERALRRFQIFVPRQRFVDLEGGVEEPVVMTEEEYEEQEEEFEDSFDDKEELSYEIPMEIELPPAVPKSAAEFAIANLESPVVLAFALGLIYSGVRSLAKALPATPESVQSAVSTYLLIAIGIKGGIALQTRSDDLSTLVLPMVVAVALGVVKSLWTYAFSRRVIGFDEPNAASMATHFGGSSAVTFLQAQAYMSLSGVPTEGYLPLVLHVIGMPGIITGLFLHAALSESDSPDSKKGVGSAVLDVFKSQSLILSIGGIALGAALGPTSPIYEAIEPLITVPFDALLAFFLLNLGVTAGERGADFLALGPKLVGFACFAPLFNACLGVLVAKEFANLSIGGAAMFGALAAGASYIAAPASVRSAIPQANASLGTTCALAVTFPFNVVVGVPFCLAFAQLVYGSPGPS